MVVHKLWVEVCSVWDWESKVRTLLEPKNFRNVLTVHEDNLDPRDTILSGTIDTLLYGRVSEDM